MDASTEEPFPYGMKCFTEQEMETELAKLALEHFGGNVEVNGLRWGKKGVNLLLCAFHDESNCPFHLRTTIQRSEGHVTRTIEFSVEEHNDHAKRVTAGPGSKRDLSKYVKSQFTNQTHLTQSVTQAFSFLQKKGMVMWQREIGAFKTWFKRRKLNHNKTSCTSSWGHAIQSTKKLCKVVSKVYGIHDPYLHQGNDATDSGIIYDENAVASDGQKFVRFACVISSQNLLLNISRSLYLGRGLSLELDTSHRYTHESVQLMPIRVRDAGFGGHTVAYGVCVRDDTTTFAHCLTILFEEYNNLIDHFKKQGKTSC